MNTLEPQSTTWGNVPLLFGPTLRYSRVSYKLAVVILAKDLIGYKKPRVSETWKGS